MDCMLWQTTDPVDIFSFCDKKNKYKTLISDLIRKKFKNICRINRLNYWSLGHHIGDNYVPEVVPQVSIDILPYVWVPQGYHFIINHPSYPSLHPWL